LRPSLRATLFVALVVTALAPIAYLGLTQVARWRQVNRHDADNELQLASTSLALSVGEVLSANVSAVTATADGITAQGSLNPQILVAVLNGYCDQFPACLGVLVAGDDARPIASYPTTSLRSALADRHYYQEMRRSGRTTFSQIEIGKFTGLPTIHVCAPVWAATRDHLTGSVVAALSLQYLSDVTARIVGAFGDMRALVLDGQGRIIAGTAEARLMGETWRAAPTDPLPAGKVILRDVVDENETPMRSASATVSHQGLGWTAVVMRPHASIEEQARRARTSTFLAVIAGLSFAVVLSFAISWLLARPIDRLARFTQAVATGRHAEPPRSMRGDPSEVSALMDSVVGMVRRLQEQADALRAREAEQVLTARLRRDLEIAERIQTGILPKSLVTPGLDVAAAMQPMEAVGGDYYDVVPTPGGCWIGIGDVSGHGLNAGLVMMMLQSALGALVAHVQAARPAEVLRAVNCLLVENIRHRLQSDEHSTLTLIHVAASGEFVFAGGHEPLLVLRAGSDVCEVLESEGPWMGINLEGAESLTESRGQLRPGDLVVLHSDGIVEAGARRREPFGLERLGAQVRRLRNLPTEDICRGLLDTARAWAAGVLEDDMTVVVVRFNGIV
jgi:serine phosphatase RsbU (regulator of sigma subunit)